MLFRSAAKKNSFRPLLKIKLGSENPLLCMEKVREGAPKSQLIVDANESWNIEILRDLAGPLTSLGVELIEQPLPAQDDQDLSSFSSPIPLCADESCRHIDDIGELKKKYSYLNIKLDKTGGLTHALEFVKQARSHGLDLMVGSMLGTSLSIAPAMLLAPYCGFVDLDGPLLLEKDRPDGLSFQNNTLHPSRGTFWG